jgi:hypothetical protein
VAASALSHMLCCAEEEPMAREASFPPPLAGEGQGGGRLRPQTGKGLAQPTSVEWMRRCGAATVSSWPFWRLIIILLSAPR